MTGENYYFLFSVAAGILPVLHLINLSYVKNKGRTLLGEKIEPGAPGFDKFNKLASSRGMSFAIVALLLLILNLAISIRLLLASQSTEAHDLLVSVPVITILFVAVMLFASSNKK